MTHVTCWLAAKNWDQLRDPTLGNRVWSIPLPFTAYTFYCRASDWDREQSVRHSPTWRWFQWVLRNRERRQSLSTQQNTISLMNRNWQFNYKVNIVQANFRVYTSGYIFLNSRRFLSDKPYNIKMQVKFAMTINEHVMTSSDQSDANPWD